MKFAMSLGQKTSYSRGTWAEGQAIAYLEKRGYKLLHSRYKTKFGEVDLIVQKGNIICFVEVKMRGNKVDALEAITGRARKRIENSALFFLSENPEFMSFDMRFDVIAIYKYGNPEGFELTHLDNACEVGA